MGRNSGNRLPDPMDLELEDNTLNEEVLARFEVKRHSLNETDRQLLLEMLGI